MKNDGVLVFGCWDNSANSGLEADARFIAAHEVPLRLVSFGRIVREENETGNAVSIDTRAEDVDEQIAGSDPESGSFAVVKIGVIASVSSLQAVCRFLQGQSHTAATGGGGGAAAVIVDSEAIFRLGPPQPDQALVTGLIGDLFPRIDVLFATVPEANALLAAAGTPAEHPKGLADLKSMGQALQRLGPKTVVIKTETLDAVDQWTALQYVMCGEFGMVMDRHYFFNPTGFFGASYSIPATTAAYMAQGLTASEAVSKGFQRTEEMLKERKHFA